jgi:mersacidin/lichenicidin family type 2 lantibiotic
MTNQDIIRAWKNPRLRSSAETTPDSPAGKIELDDAALEGVNGAKALAGGLTKYTEGCAVSGAKWSCGFVCTATTECFCKTLTIAA